MVRLVPLDESHIPALEPMLDDPVTLRFTRVPEPPPPGFARTFFERYDKGGADGNRVAFAIVDDEDEFLGVVVAPTFDRERSTAELGYMVTPAARGRGVATEAVRQLTEWAFAEGILRVELLISAENAASKKVAARCGYVREGVLRNAYVKPGLRDDTEIWSRLASD